MLKKIMTAILSSLMIMLLVMPTVSAWISSTSITMKSGTDGKTSSEVGLSKKAYYYAKNTTTDSLKGKVAMGCRAAYYTSFYSTEFTYLMSAGESKSHTEPQDILSKYKVTLKASPLWRETATASVKI